MMHASDDPQVERTFATVVMSTYHGRLDEPVDWEDSNQLGYISSQSQSTRHERESITGDMFAVCDEVSKKQGATQ